MKTLTVTVPCYNSQDYMEHCISTLLCGGEEIEIIIVDDGSTDDTPVIADRLAAEHPSIIKTIHQANAGHGGAVMTGLRNATGVFFKVVDSDDWVDEAAFLSVLSVLNGFIAGNKRVDLVVSNYVYNKVGEEKKTIRYTSAFDTDRIMTWNSVRRFRKWEYMLMHAMIYRRQVILDSGLTLPEHTFYVDNLYATVPLTKVMFLYYMDVDLYQYFIGREGQSIQEQTMIRRIDQQILVNKLLMEQVDLEHIANKMQRETILNYHEIITIVSSILLIVSGTPEHLRMKDELWDYIREEHPWEYRQLSRRLSGRILHLRGKAALKTDVAIYNIFNRIFHFN
jgi:glycosyltransferase involved in cell wall biosynthesis